MKKLFFVSTLGVLLAGCGGGGGGSNDSGSNSTSAVPNTNPSKILGAIESVDAVRNTLVVNGNSYTIDGISYNNDKVAVNKLGNNMMVQLNIVSPSRSSVGKIVHVELEPTMTGSIESITSSGGITTFSINGATLTAKDEQMTNSDGDKIEVGDWVMVSSLPTADAGYKVLSVVKFDVENEYPNFANQFEIEGRVASINKNHQTFVLGSNITVDYSGIALPQHLVRGSWVEVEGTFDGTQFTASELEMDGYDNSNDENDIEGVITSVENNTSSTPSFTLNYRGAFSTNAATCFKNDDSRCDHTLISKLREGVEVEVTSRAINGVRVASIVEFEAKELDDHWDNNEFECEGFVTNFNQDEGSFNVERCENDYDQPLRSLVMIDALTRFEGLSNADKNNMNGLKVEVEGIIINDLNIAREIELED